MSSPHENQRGADPSSGEDQGSTAAAPATSRGLADILREAGISPAGAGGRRRRRDDTETVTDEGAPAVGNADSSATAQSARADEPADRDTPTDVGGLTSYFLGRGDAVAPGSGAGGAAPPRTDTGPVPIYGWVPPGTDLPETSVPPPSPALARSAPTTTEPPPGPRSSEVGSTAVTAHPKRSPSRFARAPAEDPDEADSAVAPRSGAVGWAIFAVELLASLGLGVAAWYAFSALWELLPFVAAFAGPLVVTGLVAVAGALRARTGRNQLDLPTLCMLVFAGTVLVVLPAATVLP